MARQPPAESCEYAVPYQRAERGKQHEHPYVHLGYACGYGYELAHSRNEAAEECGGCAVVVEVFFGFLYLLLIDKAGMSESRVGESIHYGAPY